MAPKWSFGSVGVYVESEEQTREVTIASLRILDSSLNSLQYFGGGSLRRRITGIVIGDTDKNQIFSDAVAGTSRTLTSDLGSQGSYIIEQTPRFTRIRFVGATFEGTNYDVTIPIYRVEFDCVSTT